jgi:hypothetical protein
MVDIHIDPVPTGEGLDMAGLSGAFLVRKHLQEAVLELAQAQPLRALEPASARAQVELVTPRIT